GLVNKGTKKSFKKVLTKFTRNDKLRQLSRERRARPLKIKEDEPNVQGDLSKDKSSMTKQNNKTES
ncbi:TPA: hypothetical protein ACHVDC_002124, partial [Streptococcus suis]